MKTNEDRIVMKCGMRLIKAKTIMDMIRSGWSYEKIAELQGISEKEIRSLRSYYQD